MKRYDVRFVSNDDTAIADDALVVDARYTWKHEGRPASSGSAENATML